jgi:8-oxo-dGTP diphosphatase
VRGSMPGSLTRPSPRWPTIAGTRDQSSSTVIRPVSDQSCASGGWTPARAQHAAIRAVYMPVEAAARPNSPPASVAVVSQRVEAAGGVVVRDGEVLLVHRPRYDDWTFPKGKLDPDEAFEDAALREVEEETGVRCSLGRELPSSEYEVDGRPKLVRYWLMTPSGETAFEPNDETDDVRWVTPDEARRMLSYDRDRDVLAAV